MKSTLALALFASEIYLATAQKVVGLTYEKVRKPRDRTLSKRAAYINTPLGNAENLYYANITVGTPAQSLELQIDTGSSDVWMSATSAAYCKAAADNCAGGTFTSTASSTYTKVDTVFNITYVDGTGSTGTYFTDDFSIGGVTIDNLQMGLATTTTIGTGIIGVGFAADEAVCDTDTTCTTYPSIIEDMVSQDKISSKAYSLWLNDLDASTGSILFGGVDTGKYSGSLISLPMVADEGGVYTSFTVAWSSFSITSSSGTTTSYDSSAFPQAAILDSGTSLMLVPDALATELFSLYGVTESDGAYLAECSKGNTGATLNFHFGGTTGPTIKVPISEMFEPLYDTDGSVATFTNGQAACEFGIEPANGDPVLLGDTFLRSAYIVYDLDNHQVSMAQTVFNSTVTNIEEIPANAVVPGATSAAGATVTQTASRVATNAVATATASTTVVATTKASVARAGYTVPTSSHSGLVLLTMTTVFAAVGSCLLFV